MRKSEENQAWYHPFHSGAGLDPTAAILVLHCVPVAHCLATGRRWEGEGRETMRAAGRLEVVGVGAPMRTILVLLMDVYM